MYIVYDYDSEWARTKDPMKAISIALDRYRELDDGTDCGNALAEYTRVTRVYTDREGQTVRKEFDWQREYQMLTGHPAYAG